MDLIYRYDPHQTIQVDYPTDSDGAMRILKEGNQRLTSVVERMQNATLGQETEQQVIVPICPVSLGVPLWRGAIPTQHPFALVLGCSDARVPVEGIFDQSFNDLFVVRIAGNVLGTECVGSVEYAVRHFAESLKLVLVLGHTGCGAVAAAVETYLSPKDYADIAFTHALRSLVDRIMISVRGASNALREVCGRSVEHHPNYKNALKELTVYLNAAITALDLRRETQAFQSSSMRVAYGVYDLGTLFVTAVPTANPKEPSFGMAPEPGGLTDLAVSLVKALIAKGDLGDRIDVWSKIL